MKFVKKHTSLSVKQLLAFYEQDKLNLNRVVLKVDGVINRFSNDAAAQSLLVSDTSNYVRAVLKRALGDDKAALLIDRILQGSDVTGIESLKWMDPTSVAELLRNEHPQIIAAILSHLDFDQTSQVLRAFTERQRNEVMIRIATLDGIQPMAL